MKKQKKEKKESKVFSTLQMIGRSFFLPVSILPVAGILLGLGASFTNETTIAAYNLQWLLGEGTILHYVLLTMNAVGSAIFGNLPLIFAMSVALGMAKQEKAVAVLSAGISFIIMHITINTILQFQGIILADGSLAEGVLSGSTASVLGITSLEMGVFGGIVIGLVVAWLHNKFYKIKLPDVLSFFGGVRFVPIICVVGAMVTGAIMSALWPIIQQGIFAVGGLVMNSGYAGTFIFGFMERALIPFGLHHVFYIPFWQTGLGGSAIIDGVTIYGAQNIFFAELASQSTGHFSIEACRFMAGKYPFMMAGLPGAALAMYHCAKSEKKKMVGGLLLSAALTSFLTGITEPIEFTFLFIAPFLFIIHCILAGIAFVVMHVLNIAIGTTFSCGLIDFMLYGVLQGNDKTSWFLIIPVFIAYFFIYYFLFKFVIKKWNLKTPGREDDDEETKLYSKADFQAKQKGEIGADFNPQSILIVQALGGLPNLVSIDCCATRLRLEVNDPDNIDEGILKSTGSKGVIKKGSGIQVVYGPQVTVIKSDLEEYVEYLKEIGDTGESVMALGAASEEKPAKAGGEGITEVICSPVDGEIVLLEDVDDDAFAGGMLGKGVAFIPASGAVYSPIDGVVKTVFPTKHAIGIESPSGAEILIHIGLDTVKLEGKPFETTLKTGDKVKKGDLLAKFNIKEIKEGGYNIQTPMVITNADIFTDIDVIKKGKKISSGDEVLKLKR